MVQHKNRIMAIATVMLLGILWAVPAQINDILSQTTSVEIVNNTGFDIYNIFFSPADSNSWGPDVLDSTTIMETGDSVKFLVHHPERCNNFDFMAVDEDNDAYYIWETAICDDRDNIIELTLDDYSGEQAPDYDLVEVAFGNETAYAMWLLFISPSDSSYLGVDFLGSSTIMGPGDTISMYVPAGSVEVVYDVIAFDEDGDRYQFQVGVDNSRSSVSWPIEMSDLQ